MNAVVDGEATVKDTAVVDEQVAEVPMDPGPSDEPWPMNYINWIEINGKPYATPPFLFDLPEHTRTEADWLKRSVSERQKITEPVKTYDSPKYGKSLLDGRHRAKLGLALNIPVPVKHLGPMDDDEAEILAFDLNAARRQLTEEAMDKARRRRKRVQEFRSQGLSISEITRRMVESGEEVSRASVARDVAKLAVVSPETTEPAADGPDEAVPAPMPQKVTGTDGKKYQATKPKPPRRTTPPPSTKPADPVVKDVPRDKFGRQLPPHLIAVFEQGEKMRTGVAQLRAALGTIRSANKEPNVGGFLRRSPGIEPAIKDAVDDVLRAAPFVVCPPCEGTGDEGRCPTCAGQGWLDHSQYDQLHDVMKVEACRHRPSDAWEPDPKDVPPKGPPPAFVPKGAGLDANGNKIPSHLRDVFGDQYLSETAAELKRRAVALKSLSNANPFLLNPWADLVTIANHLLQNRPAVVCPTCKGEQRIRCEVCHTGRFLPYQMWYDEQESKKLAASRRQKK